MANTRSLWLLDAAAAAILFAMIAAVAWYVFFKPDTASSRVHSLGSEVSQLQADLRQLRHALDAGTAKRKWLLAETERSGRLPSRSPIDRDLETITRLADRYTIGLLGVEPVSEVQYPNVRESRYRLQTAGTYHNLLRFLQAFERCSFWADVTHFKLEQSRTDMINFDPQRKCDLILSFYSATHWQPEDQQSQELTGARTP